MENERYPYWPIVDRPRLTWPDGAKVAFWVIPNIEHFPLDEPTSPHIPRGPFPDVPSYVKRDFGNRVGVWRLMDLLDKHGITATVALNSDVCRHYPRIIEAGVQRGWKWMGHGATNARRLSGLDESSERALIQQVVQSITESTGSAPRGWLSPGQVETERTPDLLADAGITYLADWCADEQPFPMRVTHGKMIAMPYSQEINDIRAYVEQGLTAENFYQMICDQVDLLVGDGELNGRVMALAIHPYLSGHPFRAQWLDKALAYVTRHEGVWVTTGDAIADWYYERYFDQAPR